MSRECRLGSSNMDKRKNRKKSAATQHVEGNKKQARQTTYVVHHIQVFSSRHVSINRGNNVEFYL
jgi:hypothetical protein